MKPIRTLIVDDSSVFLAAAAQFLASIPPIKIVGEANSGATGLPMIAALRPDLVLLDFAMPEMNGLEVAARIKAMDNPPQVIMVTFHESSEHRDRAIAAGVDGFVPKTEFAESLAPLIFKLFSRNANGGAADGCPVTTHRGHTA